MIALRATTAAFLTALQLPATAVAAQSPPVQTAQAAPVRRILPGDSVNSSLDPANGRNHEDYLVHLDANQGVRIDLQSPAPPPGASTMAPEAAELGFDTFLEVRSPMSDAVLSSNDDRGDAITDSRVTFIAPAPGDYVVRARPLGEIFAGESATYRLSVLALPPAPEPTELPAAGVQGALDDQSPVAEAFGRPVRYDAYWFQGIAGERILLEMTAGWNEVSLQLIRSNGRSLASAISRDSSRVQVVAVLPDTGRYRVLAQAPETQTLGYTLRLARATQSTPSQPQRIRVGQAVAGSLTLVSSARLRPSGSAIDSFYQLYALDVRAGETITIMLESSDFDPLLEAGTISLLGFQPELSDNDGGSGNSAVLVLQPLGSGTVHIRARSNRLGVGAYRLEVMRGMPPRTAD